MPVYGILLFFSFAKLSFPLISIFLHLFFVCTFFTQIFIIFFHSIFPSALFALTFSNSFHFLLPFPNYLSHKASPVMFFPSFSLAVFSITFFPSYLYPFFNFSEYILRLLFLLSNCSYILSIYVSVLLFFPLKFSISFSFLLPYQSFLFFLSFSKEIYLEFCIDGAFKDKGMGVIVSLITFRRLTSSMTT